MSPDTNVRFSPEHKYFFRFSILLVPYYPLPHCSSISMGHLTSMPLFSSLRGLLSPPGFASAVWKHCRQWINKCSQYNPVFKSDLWPGVTQGCCLSKFGFQVQSQRTAWFARTGWSPRYLPCDSSFWYWVVWRGSRTFSITLRSEGRGKKGLLLL